MQSCTARAHQLAKPWQKFRNSSNQWINNHVRMLVRYYYLSERVWNNVVSYACVGTVVSDKTTASTRKRKIMSRVRKSHLECSEACFGIVLEIKREVYFLIVGEIKTNSRKQHALLCDCFCCKIFTKVSKHKFRSPGSCVRLCNSSDTCLSIFPWCLVGVFKSHLNIYIFKTAQNHMHAGSWSSKRTKPHTSSAPHSHLNAQNHTNNYCTLPYTATSDEISLWISYGLPVAHVSKWHPLLQTHSNI